MIVIYCSYILSGIYFRRDINVSSILSYSKMESLIVGHSQVKHFKTYICDPLTIPLCYPGCKVEDLLQKPSVRDLIPNVQVSTNNIDNNEYVHDQTARIYSVANCVV